MSTNTPQDPWAGAMIDVGATNPKIPGEPSWRRLSQMSGVALNTVIGAGTGAKTPRPDTVKKIARALKLSTETVSAWINGDRIIRDAYAPPAEGALLTHRQREALSEVIRSIAVEQRAGEEHAQRRSAPMKPQDAPWPPAAPPTTTSEEFVAEWDAVVSSYVTSAFMPYLTTIDTALHPDDPADEGHIRAMLAAAWKHGFSAVAIDAFATSIGAVVSTAELKPGSVIDRAVYGLASLGGTPAHSKDTRGEESQDPDDYQP